MSDSPKPVEVRRLVLEVTHYDRLDDDGYNIDNRRPSELRIWREVDGEEEPGMLYVGHFYRASVRHDGAVLKPLEIVTGEEGEIRAVGVWVEFMDRTIGEHAIII